MTPGLGVTIASVVVAAALAAWIGRLGCERAVVTAAIRAVIQLGAVSLILALIVRVGWLTAGYVAVMYGAATLTSGRRLTRGWNGKWAGIPILAGTLPLVSVVLLTGVLPAEPLAVIPVAGILIGGAMTATSLAGRRALDDLAARRGEVEAALALGLGSREAILLVCRPTAANALVPVLDQTRTVGLVVLPGAFVGMLLGGASPVEAGAVQLFVLASLLAVETLAVVFTVELIARGLISRPTTRR